MGIGQVQMLQSSLLVKTQPFFLNKCTPDCYRTLAYFQSSEIFLTAFANVRVALWKRGFSDTLNVTFSLTSLKVMSACCNP